MGHGHGTGEKAASFGPSLRRCSATSARTRLDHHGHHHDRLATVLNAVGPVILGQATNLIYSATVVNHTAIDFGAIGQVLMVALVAYIGYFVLAWLAGILVKLDRAALGVPDASPSQREDHPLAAEVLRRAAARRAAQPSHQ